MAPTPTGLIANPSVETTNPSAPATPLGWGQSRWGTNTSTLTHTTGDAHTGTRYTKVTTTAFTNGDAKWWFTHVTVQPTTSYTFTDWYRSTTTTLLVAEIRTTTGTTTWTLLRTLPPATTWTRATATFTTPANAAQMTVYHLINTIGTLDTDDTTLVRS